MNLEEQRRNVADTFIPVVFLNEARTEADVLLKAFASWCAVLGIPEELPGSWRVQGAVTLLYERAEIAEKAPVFATILGSRDASVERFVQKGSPDENTEQYRWGYVSAKVKETAISEATRYRVPVPAWAV